MPDEEYWLITYEAGGSNNTEVVDCHPIEALMLQQRYWKTSQVNIIFAMAITKEQYEKYPH